MKKRKKYKPKPILVNPMGFVLEGMAPVRDYGEYLLDLRIKHSNALALLVQGQATKDEIDTLISGANMTEAFLMMGVGEEFRAEIKRGQDALFDAAARGAKLGRFILKGEEMKAINDLFEIHDAQLDVATINDVDRAIRFVSKEVQARRVRKIPSLSTTT